MGSVRTNECVEGMRRGRLSKADQFASAARTVVELAGKERHRTRAGQLTAAEAAPTDRGTPTPLQQAHDRADVEQVHNDGWRASERTIEQLLPARPTRARQPAGRHSRRKRRIVAGRRGRLADRG
jgi:hypothetical protein